MSNVSFGGNWSEELVTAKEWEELFYDLDWAVENCRMQNVDTPAVRAALDMVRTSLEKGPMLAARFHKAMQIENRDLRKHQMMSTLVLIKNWGLGA